MFILNSILDYQFLEKEKIIIKDSFNKYIDTTKTDSLDIQLNR